MIISQLKLAILLNKLRTNPIFYLVFKERCKNLLFPFSDVLTDFEKRPHRTTIITEPEIPDWIEVAELELVCNEPTVWGLTWTLYYGQPAEVIAAEHQIDGGAWEAEFAVFPTSANETSVGNAFCPATTGQSVKFRIRAEDGGGGPITDWLESNTVISL